MATYLCIDIGNTRTKAALYTAESAEKPLLNQVFEGADLPEAFIGEMLQNCAVEGAAICSVKGSESVIEETLASLHIPVLKINDKTPLPIINAYRSADTLGPDRLALAVGLLEVFPDGNALAISAGTCITYNFLTDRKTFRGGLISPGVQMRLDAMHHFTARLPQVSLSGDAPLLGYDTESSIRSGALLGAAVEIEGFVNRYAEKYGTGFNAVLTGGNASELSGHLKCRIFADPFLLLKGLHRILRYNALSLRLAL